MHPSICHEGSILSSDLLDAIECGDTGKHSQKPADYDLPSRTAVRHDFYEVDYLPENDRIRYTIHPDARKELLKRLLKLNHQRYAEEVAAGLHDKKGKKKTTKKKVAQRKKGNDELL